MAAPATIVITLALVFYSIGVWAERIAGRLKAWHLVFFWLGLAFDTWGTEMMLGLAGRFDLHLHSVTGFLAIILMLLHAVWASIVLIRGDERWIINFHKLSVVVWCIWLVPYLSPMLFGLR